jgi:hypothetical protein
MAKEIGIIARTQLVLSLGLFSFSAMLHLNVLLHVQLPL